MGLRDYLAQLAAIGEQSSQFAESATKLRQQAAQQQMVESLPGLVKEGDWGTIAAQALESGDPTLTRMLLASGYKGQVAAQKPGEALTAEQADVIEKTGGLEKGSLTPFIGAKPTLATATANLGANVTKAKTSAAQFQTAEQRRAEETTQAQRKAASQQFGKLEDKLAEEKRAIDKVEAAFKQNTLPSDSIVLNFIARNMAGEKGPLNEGDIMRLTGRSFQGDTQAALNWIQSTVDPKAAPELRKAYKEMLAIAKSNYETYKTEAVSREFAQALEDNPKLLNDKNFQKKAERLGGKITSDGKFEFVKKQTKVQAANNEANNAAALMKMAAQISDPVKRKQALDALAAFDKKVMDEETYKKFDERIRALGGK